MFTSITPFELGLRWHLKYPTVSPMAARRPDTRIPTKTEDPEDDEGGAFVSCEEEETRFGLRTTTNNMRVTNRDPRGSAWFDLNLFFLNMVLLMKPSSSHPSTQASNVLSPCPWFVYCGGSQSKWSASLWEHKVFQTSGFILFCCNTKVQGVEFIRGSEWNFHAHRRHWKPSAFCQFDAETDGSFVSHTRLQENPQLGVWTLPKKRK